MTDSAIEDVVRERYAAAARNVARGSCCGGGGAALKGADPITAELYGEDETRALPEAAVLAWLGCGNPTALAELGPGGCC